MVVLLKTTSVRVSFIQIMQIRVQNKRKSVRKVDTTKTYQGILKIAYLFDYASYEDVLCMNVDQHDVNSLVVPFLTMNKTPNMMLSLFEKGVLI